MKLHTALLASWLAGAGLAVAQAPITMIPWWEGRLATEINLTDGQKEQVQSILRENRADMIDQRAAAEKAELRVEELLDADSIDVSETNRAIDRLLDARTKLARSYSRMAVQLRAVLTPEQWETVKSRAPRRNRPFGENGPRRRGPPRGGFPGPPNQ